MESLFKNKFKITILVVRHISTHESSLILNTKYVPCIWLRRDFGRSNNSNTFMFTPPLVGAPPAPHLQLHRVTATWGYTRKQCCRKETARCRSYSFRFNVRQPYKLNQTKKIVFKSRCEWIMQIYVTRHLPYPCFSRNFVVFLLE